MVYDALGGGEGESLSRLKEQWAGVWHGRATQWSAATGSCITADSARFEYVVSNARVEQNDSGDDALTRVSGEITTGAGEQSRHAFTLRYNCEDVFVFSDGGSFSSEHWMFEGYPYGPRGASAGFLTTMAIEHCVSLSATERFRCFVCYDAAKCLERIVLCEEVRDACWENRDPLSIVSLLGTWQGQARMKRSKVAGSGFMNFDLISTFGWDGEAAVRRSQKMQARLSDALISEKSASDAQQKRPKVPATVDEILRLNNVSQGAAKQEEPTITTTYGEYDGNNRIILGSAPHTHVMYLLSHGAYVVSPASLDLNVPWNSEFALHLSEDNRKRVVRLYTKDNVPASDVLSVESRL
ncbi:hypothetical protein FVE85_0323 [Porphyridium purpureum]|uniref:Uncharacterized protein n=1 Tax=Porphyridium purpureum TaxID=35688 RepID=A0A5J4Z110_PORPP|nr:hypothetical protein FVE85_0323 [Porphyridium purpureum]|eukprot:POR3918..scf208_2